MAPSLLAGDWLLVDPDAFHHEPPRPGDLVVALDPREPERLLIKRVGTAGSYGILTLLGDATGASTDSRTFGPVPVTAVVGRAWFRYWPLRRVGRIG